MTPRASRRLTSLPAATWIAILPGMFVVTEADAAAIRELFEEQGELTAAIELRRRFPGIIDNTRARVCARTIAGRQPQPSPAPVVTRLHPRKN